ncbi:hypothetical protein L686_07090 [Stutzerimonas stutzeri MF28]|uniref:Uncharacterized protein n=1 Tax=Stutzerimonas stutzeri TaxID=316 RepID=A0A2N8SSU8_STUST|nr:hypothetical protein L686_07090 [Stutzerimonas stutzeri MF28]PNG05533.1 hypothetical protein CXL00_12530 [Stutzerimonas stutzeri]
MLFAQAAGLWLRSGRVGLTWQARRNHRGITPRYRQAPLRYVALLRNRDAADASPQPQRGDRNARQKQAAYSAGGWLRFRLEALAAKVPAALGKDSPGQVDQG